MKPKLLLVLLTLALSSSCQDQKKPKTNETQEASISIIRKVFEHFNNHEWDKMANLYSDTADFRDPSLGQDIVKQNRKQTTEKYTGMAKIFPDIKDEVVNIYPSGDKNVIVEFVSSASAPNGSRWSLPICTIFTIENGVITKDFTYYDNQ